MKVFVVTTSYMHSIACEKVFSSLQNAEFYLENRDQGERGGPQIEEMYVIGEVSNSTVFTAETYDRGTDIHYFVALYGNYDAASARAGQNGLVRNLKIDG